MNPPPSRRARRPVLRARAATHMGHPDRWVLQFDRPRRFSDLDWLVIALFGVVLILALADRFAIGLPTWDVTAKELAIGAVILVVAVWAIRRSVGRRIRPRLRIPVSLAAVRRDDLWLLLACFLAALAGFGFDLYSKGRHTEPVPIAFAVVLSAIAALAVVALRRTMRAAAAARQQPSIDLQVPESAELHADRFLLRYPDREEKLPWADVTVRSRTPNTFVLDGGKAAKIIVYLRAFASFDESIAFRTWAAQRSVAATRRPPSRRP